MQGPCVRAWVGQITRFGDSSLQSPRHDQRMTTLHRDHPGSTLFRNRTEAGVQLAERLRSFARMRPIVLGLPRGGVSIAAQVARVLDAPLDIIVVRKLCVPFQPELAMGAIGEDGVLTLNEELIRLAHVTEHDIARAEITEREELRRRATRFRVHHPRRDLRSRTVIIVDDGLATGATAIAACEVARSLGALHIIVAVPVAPPEAADRLADHADEFIALATPSDFHAVGQFYDHFGQVNDREVLDMLNEYTDGEPWAKRAAVPTTASTPAGLPVQTPGRRPVPTPARAGFLPIIDTEVVLEVDGVRLPGHLVIPAKAIGVVLFAHGSGSSRHSPRNLQVAEMLQMASIGTLLFDLLTEQEEVDQANVFDIELLAGRLLAATAWVHERPECAALPISYFGASTGAGAALWAAAVSSVPIASVVSRGGRPDLAGVHLKDVTSPTLLIVGSRDRPVIDLNCDAAELIAGATRMVVIPGATHLFEEPGTLLAAAEEAVRWFEQHVPNKDNGTARAALPL